MDGLYELCSEKLKDDRETKPKSSSPAGVGGGNGGVVKKKHGKKKKGSDTKARIDEDSGHAARSTRPAAGGGGGGDGGRGSKRSRSPDNDGAGRPRLLTSRSTRSSPSATDHDSSAVDEKPQKRRRTEMTANPRTGVLKVPPSAFPREVYLGKDVDPSTPDDLTKVFTPDGSFSVDDPACPIGSIGAIAAQTYQDMIPSPEALCTNFLACAVCGLGNEDERIACIKCPRSYHVKCFEDSCLPAIADDPSSRDQDRQKMKECVRCEYDQVVRPEEEISTALKAMNKSPEMRKIDKAYGKYKAVARSYSYMSLVLWELLQILEKLKSYEYGEIFAVPGQFLIDPPWLFASFSIVF